LSVYPLPVRAALFLSLLAIGVASCGSTRTGQPVPSASAPARGPRVDWHGRTADQLPTEFFAKNAPLPVSYEVDVAVDRAFAFEWLDEGAFFDGSVVYYDRAYALRRATPARGGDEDPPGLDLVVHANAGPSDAKVRDPRKRLRAMSRDGKMLAGVNKDGISILVPSADSVSEIPVLATQEPVVSPLFATDGSTLYYVERGPRNEGGTRGPTQLHAFAIDARTDKVVTALAPDAVLLDVRAKDTSRGAELLVGGSTIEKLELDAERRAGTVTRIDAIDARFAEERDDGTIVAIVREGGKAWIALETANGSALGRSRELRDPLDLWVDRAQHRVAYQDLSEDGKSRLAVLTLPALEPVAIPPVRDAVTARVLSMTGDGGSWVLATEGAQAFTTLWVVDWKSGSWRAVHPAGICADDACVAPPWMNAASDDRYTASDGSTRPLYARTPQACEGAACPVVIHARERGGGLYDCWSLALDASGFVTIDAPIRLGAGRDLEDVADVVRKRIGKGRKIGVYGRGAVAGAVLEVMRRAPRTFDAAALIDPTDMPGRDATTLDPLFILEPLHGSSPAGDAFELVRNLTDRRVEAKVAYVPDEVSELFERGGYAKQLVTWFTRILGGDNAR
jgi:hypothetical protein